MKSYRYFRLAAVLLLGAAALLLLCSCGEKQEENVAFSTYLNLSSSFSGSRTIKVSYPRSIVEPGSDAAADLETVIRKNCPSSMTYSADNTSENVAYIFPLSFSSYSDYTSKIADILGNAPVVTFSNPNTALTKGWRISEDFQSCQLLSWISEMSAAEGHALPEHKNEEHETKVTYGNTTVASDAVISVNKLNGQPIEKIRVVTVNKTTATESKFDRTITFTVTQKTFDSLGDKLTQYFSSVTDSAANSEWLLDNNRYIYTVTFSDVTMKQLEGYTNHLLSSVYGDVSYIDKTESSTALAYQNCFSETLDFSNYVGPSNSDVPVEYSYSLINNSTLDECRIYSEMKWVTATDLLKENNPGKIAAIRSSSPTLTLMINDGKQYTPTSVDIAVTPLDNDTIKKSFSFVYDIASEGYEASDYTASYFTPLGIIPSQTVVDGSAVCTITVTGTPAELNAKITDIFGDNNLITLSDEVPFMTLRTKKHIEDKVDLSVLLVGKNVDTPVNYSIIPAEGEIAEQLILKGSSNDDDVYAEPDEKGVYKLTIGSKASKLSLTVSAPNISDIIIFCAISFIMLLVTAGFIFILARQKLPVHSLESGEGNGPALPKNGQNKKRISEKSILRKKTANKDKKQK